MNAEDLVSHNGSDGQGVEAIDEGFPRLDVTATLAFVVEPVHTGDVGTFVVSPKQEKVLGKLELVTQKKQDRFQRLFSPINVVAEEEVVG